MTNEEDLKQFKREWYKQYRNANKDKINAYQRQYRKNNPDKVKKYTQTYWEHKYLKEMGE